MKGIILAGGSGTRLYPITKGVSKQLLPVYDKPMVYYPLSALFLAGIRDILLISTPEDLGGFRRLLGDGSDYGVRISYAEQPSPDGLAQAFLIGSDFIGDDSVCLVLGDNIFHGSGFTGLLREAVRTAEEDGKATVFGYRVDDPQRYGVAEFEITSVNQSFLQSGELKVQTLQRGFAWLDTGTHDSLAEASIFVEVIEKRQGLKIACLEGIAYHNGWITAAKLRELAQPMLRNQYGQYLLKLTDENRR